MCGIVGLLTETRDLGADIALLHRMRDSIRHRGPDDEGVWLDSHAGIALCHRRLSIIDLSSTGHQPMVSHSGRSVIVFNGEIYNFQELRAALGIDQHKFRGRSDTEVLLEAIEKWGLDETLRRARGMFALAVWDQVERRLELARDRMGEKPLYIAHAGKDFVFASELKAVIAHPDFDRTIDDSSTARFLELGYVPAPRTIYRRALKLIPGSILSLDRAALREPISEEWLQQHSRRYWTLDDVATTKVRLDVSSEDAARQLETTLASAVKEQMIADVPLGAFLSGGIDSSLVVALMQSEASRPVKTFTIGFTEQGYDESGHASAVAKHLGTDHTTYMISPAEALEVIPRLSAIYDEPFADSSQIPTLLVCRHARREVKVALSGDAGDESFGGYNRHLWAPKMWQQIRRWPRWLRSAGARAIDAVPTGVWSGLFQITGLANESGIGHRLPTEKLAKLASVLDAEAESTIYLRLTHQPGASSLLRDRACRGRATSRQLLWPSHLPFAEGMMFLDAVTYLPDDILVKLDRAAMSVSLETRVPLLDPRVLDLAWRLPLATKIGRKGGKLVLRDLLSKYVPVELTDRPKTGFGVPIDEWLRLPLRAWAEDLLNDRSFTGTFALDSVRLKVIWHEHLTRRRNWHHLIWSVLMLQSWLHASHRAHG